MPSRPTNSRRPSSSGSAKRNTNQTGNGARGGNNRVGNTRNGIRATNRGKAKRSAQSSAPGRIPAWAWIILFLIIGVLLGKHFFGSSQPAAPKPGDAAIVTRPISELDEDNNGQQGNGKNNGQSSNTTTKMPTFEFYTLLPESEVISPNVPNAQNQSSSSSGSSSAPGTTASNTSSAPSAAKSNNSPTSTSTASTQQTSHPSTQSAPKASSSSSSTPSTSLGGARYMLQAASFQKQADAQTLAAKFQNLGLKMQVTQVQTSDGSTWFRVQAGPYSDSNSLSKARSVMQSNGIDPLIIRQR